MLSQKRKGQNESLGSFLKSHREQAGFTQKALADSIGLEYYTMISQMELGYVSIPPSLWVPLATTLGMDRSDFSLRCLSSYQPEVYNALFGQRGRKEVAEFLGGFLRGKYDRPAKNGEKPVA